MENNQMDMISFAAAKLDYPDTACKERTALNIVYILFLMNTF